MFPFSSSWSGIISRKSPAIGVNMVKGKIKQQKIFYTCDICGKAHKNLDAAEKCEASHDRPAGGIRGILGKLFRRGEKE